MKTITIDFETYQNELKNARIEGFNKRGDIYGQLKKYIQHLESYNTHERQTALREVGKLMCELEDGTQ